MTAFAGDATAETAPADATLDRGALGAGVATQLLFDDKFIAESDGGVAIIMNPPVNDVARVATWRGKSDVRPLAGKPVRLRIEARAAKLHAFQFASSLNGMEASSP